MQGAGWGTDASTNFKCSQFSVTDQQLSGVENFRINNFEALTTFGSTTFSYSQLLAGHGRIKAGWMDRPSSLASTFGLGFGV